ncbi:MAG: hypothetical protein KTV68_13325 [Acidimicrobiia bacterium]|nr:hypothetical protein [Acidimicrobiia bacterium]MCY4435554.1 hypothetical protein [bacterium]
MTEQNAEPRCSQGYTLVSPRLGREFCQRTIETDPVEHCESGVPERGRWRLTCDNVAAYHCADSTLGFGAFGVPYRRQTASWQCPPGDYGIPIGPSNCYNLDGGITA